MTSISAKKVWTSRGWLSNTVVHIANGIITSIGQSETDGCDVPVLVPGMIELHAHGSFGFNSASPNTEQNELWLKRLALHGVTGILPTLSSSPADKINRAVNFYADIMKHPVKDGARVLGVHLEGPFLNVEKKGGINPDYLHVPDVSHFELIASKNTDAVRLITLAPELEGAKELIKYLKRKDIYINAGHSNATAEQMRDGILCGVDGVTHFFNAARPITHRDPGLLTEALITKKVFCEMVSDLVHLAPEIIHLLVQAAGARRIAVVTDAVTLTGMPDGQYDNRVVVNGSPRLQNGTLTGGRYLTDGCARSLIKIGVDPWDVFCMTSNTPARRIGLTDVGDIAPYCKANLIAMNDDYKNLFTIIEGNIIRES